MRNPSRLVVLLALAGCASGSDTVTDVTPPAAIAAQVIVVLGDSQTGTVHASLAQPVAVRVLDHNQRAMRNQPVVWRIVKGGGSVFAGFGLTDSTGKIQEQWTLGDTAGVQQLEARAIDSTGAPIVFARITATAQPGPLAYQSVTAHRVFAFRDSLTPLPVLARDAYGNGLPVTGLVAVGDTSRLGGVTGTSWRPRDFGRIRFVLGTDTILAFAVPGRPLSWSWAKAGTNGVLAFAGIDSSGSGACAPNWCAWARYSGTTTAAFYLDDRDTTMVRQISFGGQSLNLYAMSAGALRYGPFNTDTLVIQR